MAAKTLLLAAAWMALTGSAAPENAVFALGLAYAALRLFGSGAPPGAGLLRKLPSAGGLFVFFLWELLVANVKVALCVLRPGRYLRPGIVAVPLDVRSEAGIALLANLITLTPGTLSVEIAEDQATLYVHALTVDDPSALRAEIKQGFERRVRQVLA